MLKRVKKGLVVTLKFVIHETEFGSHTMVAPSSHV